ncbi:TonB-dependent receptor [Sinomicrobium kalidii]|uniref:TonB-dependent receptor domain-containing protein n=1 Tax=Sinomicrobium kalidii TaxID=2900738 RepID=UPI001E412A00|nr:outer membrane beta-barrel family protein [Sinomicrobium kalidii]UGU14447.1 TonB-dependent receptor [Sinomicrobium kalidii]
MKPNRLLFILFMILPIHIYSQFQISGKVTDSEGQAIEFANVVLVPQIKKDIVKGAITDYGGVFHITNVSMGTYKVTISFMGYEDWNKNIQVDKDINVGTLKLKESAETLAEVVVEGKKPLIERKVDRLVFNVENSIAATGGDVLDALRVTPRIKVQNDQISMIGKSGMAVMLDDKLLQLSGEDLITFLRSIKSEDIKSIEVITNPPAKYSAEGNSGLINIKTKRLKYDSWGAALQSTYRQATYPISTIGGNFNYRKNKISITSSINYLNGSLAPDLNSKIYYPEILWTEENNRKDFYNSFNARLGVEYRISEKTSMGINYNRVDNKPGIRDDINTKIINRSSSRIDSLINTTAESTIKRNSNIFNYHLVHNIDTIGRKLSIDADYFNYENHMNRNFRTNTFLPSGDNIEESYEAADNIGFQKVDNYSVSADMEHPLQWMNLNYGGRLSFTKTSNKFSFYDLTSGAPILDLNQSNEFIFHEDTQALYISAQKEIGDKWEVQAGLRMENTQTKGNSLTLNQVNKISYTEFFPTAYIVYTPNENHSFSINYGRRINRPSFGLLNPFRWVASPYSYSEGNPYLLPAFNQNIEFEYSYKDFWVSTIYFSSLSDGFEQVTIIDDQTKVQQIIPLNFVSHKMFGINEYLFVNPTDWMETNFYADIYYSSSKSKIPETLDFLSGWNGEFTINNNLILNKDKTMFFSLSYSYVTKGVDNLDRNTAFSQLNAALKFFFMDKKLQLSIYGNDILRTNNPEYISYSNNIKNSFKNYRDERFLRVALLYKFGAKIKTSGKREIKNQEEIDRSND